MIPMPWLIVGVLVSLFGTYRVGHHYGWLERDNDMKLAIAKKNEESRKTEQKLTEQINSTATKLLETNNVVNEKQSALDRAIRAGRVRLSPSSCVSTTANPAPAAINPERGSESNGQANEASNEERATLQAIAEIVAQGDKNTAALNACVDSYNQMRDLINGKP